VLVQSIVAPNFYPRAQYQDQMSAQVADGRVATFKVYTAWGPNQRGYALDDPEIGLPAIEHARDLGIEVIAAHKGLPIQGFDQRFNGPRDVVAVAKHYPDMQFVVFHSAFERATTEGPYDPGRALRGTNSLLKAMDDLGVAPNSNVWCDLGTTWRETMANPTQAAHVVGKLLSRVGTDRVLWGTDAIWYGTPQPQIMAFRAFQITTEFQERFGYPALTDEVKAKVFGLNAANLLHLDPAAQRCAVDASRLNAGKTAFTQLHEAGDITEPWPARAPLTRRETLAWLRRDPRATFDPF
jgi:predicted TIM-barrel fold metal-dependent hydrolase